MIKKLHLSTMVELKHYISNLLIDNFDDVSVDNIVRIDNQYIQVLIEELPNKHKYF